MRPRPIASSALLRVCVGPVASGVISRWQRSVPFRERQTSESLGNYNQIVYQCQVIMDSWGIGGVHKIINWGCSSGELLVQEESEQVFGYNSWSKEGLNCSHKNGNKRAGVRKMKFVENTPEALLLDIGRVLNEAGVTKEEALRALERARREIYG
jgi:hypothetical protein